MEPPRPSLILFPKDDNNEKEESSEDDGKKFGLANDFDRQADEAASQKLACMLEERYTQAELHVPV